MIAAALAGLFCEPFSARAQPNDSPATAPASRPAGLLIDGDVQHPITLSLKALAALPHVQVSASDHGHRHEYAGVPVRNLLEMAGVPLGPKLRGKAMSLFVLAVGADDYKALYALFELDDASRQIIVADSADGKPLDAAHGPLRMIAPQDPRPARSVRQLVELKVLDAAAQ